MTPSVAQSGHSFKMAFRYYLHDKRAEGATEYPTSSERVAWTDVRNLAVSDPQAAMRIMVATAQQADQLKAAAGVKNTGRKSRAHVYAYSLSWRADEVENLTREHMLECVDETLKLLGAEDRQAVIVCHNDTAHPHVHVIINRVDPHTGRMVGNGNDYIKLDAWANEYERKNGKIVTPKREEKRQLREKFTDQAQRQEYAGEKRRQAEKKPQTKAGMLKEFGDQQKAEHAQQWKDLSAKNKDARNQIWATYDERIKSAIAKHKAECKPLWAAFFKEQRTAQRAYERNERAGLTGVLINAFSAASHQKATGQDQGRGYLSLVFANTLSGQARRAIFDQRQELGRKAMQEKLRGVLSAELDALKDRRAEGLNKQRQGFDQARGALIEKQDSERAKIREAWRQIYSDRGKDASLRSTTFRARIDAQKAWQDERTATKQHQAEAKAKRATRPAPTESRAQIAKSIEKREQFRQDEREREKPRSRPSYISRPAPSPAPAGAGPRAAQKTAAALPSKVLPETPKQVKAAQAFKELNRTDQPRHTQSPSEIRAQYGNAGRSGLEEKRERSRTRGRTRSRSRSISDDNDL